VSPLLVVGLAVSVVMVVSALATIAGAAYVLVKDRERRWAR
jgi:hypothetical protein